MTAIKDMTLDQLRAELEWSTRKLEVHRRDGDRNWCMQRCDEDFPCAHWRVAQETVKEVRAVLAQRHDRPPIDELLDKARRDWLQ